MKKLNKLLVHNCIMHCSKHKSCFSFVRYVSANLSVILSQALTSINAQIPMNLDGDTRLDLAAPAGNLLTITPWLCMRLES